MYQKPTAPQTIGDVLDDSFRLYRATLRLWLLPSLVMAVVSGAFAVYMLLKLGPVVARPTDLQYLTRFRTFGSGYVLMTALSIWLYLAMFAAMLAVQSGTPVSVTACVVTGLRRLPAAIIATIFFFVATIVGFCLLVVPGLWIMGQLQFWPAAMVERGLGPFAASGESWRLVRGHWWRAATILTVLFIIVVVLSMMVGGVAALLTIFGGSDLVMRMVAAQVLGHAVNVFIVPLFPAAMAATYADLKLRRDGGDLEARLRDLKPA